MERKTSERDEREYDVCQGGPSTRPDHSRSNGRSKSKSDVQKSAEAAHKRPLFLGCEEQGNRS